MRCLLTPFFLCLSLCTWLLTSLLTPTYAHQSPFAESLQKHQFPPPEQVFVLDYQQIDSRLVIRFQIADDFYLYQHRFDFSPIEKIAQKHPLPAGEAYVDQYFGEVVVYRDQVEFVVDLEASKRNEVLTVHYQGCADEGYCYPPSTQSIFLRKTKGYQAHTDGRTSSASTRSLKTASFGFFFGLFALGLWGFRKVRLSM